MNVKLTEHAAELLEAVRAQRHEPVEQILEHALEMLAREEHVEGEPLASRESRARAVAEMLDFIKHNRIRLDPGVSVKDLIHEGHRI
jgi:hypothetical protein